MAIIVGSEKKLTTDDGIPYMWQSCDVTTTPNEVGIITASDGASYDYFGSSVAVGSGRIVVGAFGHDVGANLGQGSAYIFDLDGNQLGIITASDGAYGDSFGRSVAVGSGRIVVGAPGRDVAPMSVNQGSAYIFDLDGNQLGIITASDGAIDDSFGGSVAVGNGRIVVGASVHDVGSNLNQGSAYIFDLDGNQLGIITASDGTSYDNFGSSVAVGNGRIVVGGTGVAYVYNLDGTNEIKLTTSNYYEYFGRSVSVGGGRIVVGSFTGEANFGVLYIYDLNGNYITHFSNDSFLGEVAVGLGRIVFQSGDFEASIFDLEGNELDKKASNGGVLGEYFGSSIAVGCGRIVVGAQGDYGSNYGQGSVYIYETPQVYTLYDAIDLNYG